MWDFIEQKGLVNVVNTPEGITCQCPICFGQGNDLTGRNHLSIRRDGVFNCLVGSKNDPNHNRSLYSLLYKGEDLQIIFTPQEPKAKIVKVYSEKLLDKLVPDYTYWNKRGISDATLRLLGGGLAPVERSKLSGRFVFPCRDSHGRLIGFSGRLVADNEFAPKWKHLVPSSLALWPLNLSQPFIAASKTVVILESIGDALTCWERGIKNTLVIFGLNISSKMIGTLIAMNLKHIIISTNNDIKNQAGNNAALSIKAALASFYDESHLIIHLPESKDWGVAQDIEFEGLRMVLI